MRDGGNNAMGSEDNSQAVRNQQEVQENTRAIQESNRRVEASVSPEVRDRPIQASGVTAAAGQGGEDNSQAVRNMQEVRENTRANAEQARRVEASTPPEIRSESRRS
jgi:hypothetical protein